MSVITLLAAYLLGGLTFIPVVLILVLCCAYFTLPQWSARVTPAEIQDPLSGHESLAMAEKLQQRNHEPDVAASYFTVCREFVPGGVNGRPPERTTPAGETIATESPSVYQSMYRTIFDRNKMQGPSIEGGKAVKKAKNVFYVVLRFATRCMMPPTNIVRTKLQLGTATLCYSTVRSN